MVMLFEISDLICSVTNRGWRLWCGTVVRDR